MFVRRNDPTGAMSSAELRKISRISRRHTVLGNMLFHSRYIYQFVKSISVVRHISNTLDYNIHYMPYLVTDRRVHYPNSLLLLISRAIFVAFW